MKKILIINSSAREFKSQSRELASIFADHWKGIYDNPEITYRNLGNEHVPHINQSWISAASKTEMTRSEDEKQALKTSNTYISELQEADVIVLASPMYNWSVPSVLKAYIDQIVRVNETFKYDAANIENPYTGLLENKILVLLLSRGEPGYEKGDYNEHLNFQTAYLKMVFNMIGVSIVHTISVSGVSHGSGKLEAAKIISRQEIKNLIDRELV